MELLAQHYQPIVIYWRLAKISENIDDFFSQKRQSCLNVTGFSVSLKMLASVYFMGRCGETVILVYG